MAGACDRKICCLCASLSIPFIPCRVSSASIAALANNPPRLQTIQSPRVFDVQISRLRDEARSICSWTSIPTEIPCRCPSRDTPPPPSPGPPGSSSSSDMVPVHLARRQSSRRPPRANVAFSSSARLPDGHSLASGSGEENPGSLAP